MWAHCNKTTDCNKTTEAGIHRCDQRKRRVRLRGWGGHYQKKGSSLRMGFVIENAWCFWEFSLLKSCKKKLKLLLMVFPWRIELVSSGIYSFKRSILVDKFSTKIKILCIIGELSNFTWSPTDFHSLVTTPCQLEMGWKLFL